MAHSERTKKMYLGKNYEDLRENFKSLFPPENKDMVIVARRKGLWLLSLKEARYLKYHIARVTPDEMQTHVEYDKSKIIHDRISSLIKIGVL